MSDPQPLKADVVLVGAGIMSATLGVLLKELDPTLKMVVIESLNEVAAESSDPWNNAGTGHAALCELNYTPENADGSIDISKAIKINEQFEVSKQFWSYYMEKYKSDEAPKFLNQSPHISFVWGEKNVAYLKRRYDTLQTCPLFRGMQFSTDPQVLKEWMPLVMEGREPGQAVAANRMAIGTDVNFGTLTKDYLDHMRKVGNFSLLFGRRVTSLRRASGGGWDLKIHDRASGANSHMQAKFIFLGAGGGALPLLLNSGIPEGKGFGGFPVSGQWLRCKNEELITRHQAKVYGKAGVGAPPMSVPHLDTRVIDGKKGLLFGPYAGFSTKFLKTGSLLDLPLSLRPHNVFPMMAAGLANMGLTKYLIGQVLQSQDDRITSLKEFVPHAVSKDWELLIAGQRVQVIKYDAKKIGILQFGTEVVASADGSITALLGASPGASIAVPVMIDLIKRCFKDSFASPEWKSKIKQMAPSYGIDLAKDVDLYNEQRARTNAILYLNEKA